MTNEQHKAAQSPSDVPTTEFTEATGATPIKPKIVEMRETGATWDEIGAAVGINRVTTWKWRKADPDFAAACAVASEIGIEAIEDALQVAAVKVADDPRYTKAAIFSLKNRCPERWRDVKDHRHSGQIDLTHMSDEELERMAHALDEDGEPEA